MAQYTPVAIWDFILRPCIMPATVKQKNWCRKTMHSNMIWRIAYLGLTVWNKPGKKAALLKAGCINVSTVAQYHEF